MIKEFRKIIKEEVQREFILRELFERAFDYKKEREKHSHDGSVFEYAFTTFEGIDYYVYLIYYNKSDKPFLEIEFKTKQYSYNSTNEGVASRVIRTVIEIVKEVLKEIPPVKYFKVSAIKKDGEDMSRFKLYKIAIKRFLPNAEIFDKNNNYTKVRFKVRLPEDYKKNL